MPCRTPKAAITLIKEWKEREGKGRRNSLWELTPTLNRKQMLKKTLSKCKLLKHPLVQEHILYEPGTYTYLNATDYKDLCSLRCWIAFNSLAMETWVGERLNTSHQVHFNLFKKKPTGCPLQYTCLSLTVFFLFWSSATMCCCSVSKDSASVWTLVISLSTAATCCSMSDIFSFKQEVTNCITSSSRKSQQVNHRISNTSHSSTALSNFGRPDLSFSIAVPCLETS